MKKLVISLMVGLLLTVLPQAGFCGSGKTIAPFWGASNNQNSYLSLTNITSHAITISVKFYQEDGAVYPSSNLSFTNFSNNNTELDPGKTGIIQVSNPTSVLKYGPLEVSWSNKGSDNDLYALIGHGVRAVVDSYQSWAINISLNDSKPF